MAERTAAELLAVALRRSGLVRGVRRAEAVVAWPKVAGPAVARFAVARALRNGVLLVDVPDSETAMHLSMQRGRFLDALERHLGRREVREIRFAAGRAETPPLAPPATGELDPDPETWTALAKRLGSLDLPERLERVAAEAARSFARHRSRAKAQGWTPCPTCGALAPRSEGCDACLRHAASPPVQRAAERLATDPQARLAELSPEERAVATALAIGRLDGTLASLAPQAVLDRSLRPQLAAAAVHRVALASGVAPAQVDGAALQRFDPRLARIVGDAAEADDPGKEPT